MPSPAPWPSRLVCSGNVLQDSNGFTLPQMKGLNVNPSTKGFSTPPVLQDFLDMYDKGVRYVRVLCSWNNIEPTQGTFNATWQTYIDNVILNCASVASSRASGIYVWLNLCFNGSAGALGSLPPWMNSGNGVGPQGSLQNYVNSNQGQFWTQALASRYGNSSGTFLTANPQCVNVVIGMGINEPVADYINNTGSPGGNTGNTWVTNHATEQLQMVTWVRAAGNAPNWIVALAAGPSAGTALLPNVTGSGQTAQTFTGASTTWSTNFIIDVHDPIKVASTNKGAPSWPSYDGRNATFGGLGGSTLVQQDNTTYPGYYDLNTQQTCVSAISRAQMQTMMTAWWANYLSYATTASCPIAIMECNWHPIHTLQPLTGNVTGPGGALAAAYVADKVALFASLSPSPVMISEWEYQTDQSHDNAAVRPGAAAYGADADGWLHFTNQLLSSSTSQTPRMLQNEAGTAWYRLNHPGG